MRARWAAALACAAAIVLGGVVSTAAATDPVELERGFITDVAGVLDASEETALESRLTTLADGGDAALFVVLVPTFSNPSDSAEWAYEVAVDNGLGSHQYLLALAIDSRQYNLSADTQQGPLSEDQLVQIERSAESALRDDDWSGAVTIVADGIDEALSPGTGPIGVSVGSGGAFAVVAVLLLGIAGVIVWLIVRRRRAPSPAGPSIDPVVPIEELERAASSALVQTDDAIRTSVEELGFARAQFGEEATSEFEATLARAKDLLSEAFSLKQKLDDEIPDTPDETRQWNIRIIELCRTANQDLDAKAVAFDELRKLEQNAPEALHRVQDEQAQVAAGIAAAESTLATLTDTYAPDALAPVTDNVDQARSRLAFATAQLAEAESAIGSGRGGEAAVGIRAAEEAVDQARLLEDAIGALARDLTQSEEAAAALIRDLEQDIATTATLPDEDAKIADIVGRVRTTITAAHENLAGSDRHPSRVLDDLRSADSQLDAIVTGVRNAQEQAQRAQQQLQQAVLQAQGQISAAEDFITARRGAVGAEARTRLAEAGASLNQARQLQPHDTAAALQQAQRAQQLAAQATASAQRDVGAFSTPGGVGGGSGGDIMGAVLGGIVINSLLGGGGRSRGGGFGGGRSSGSRGGSSRTIRPGSFGGGSTRGRRGGGRF